MVEINNISELQVSLIAIGIVVIMAVLLFNWMQQRRYRRTAEQAFGQKPEDVLLRPDMSVGTSAGDGERIEPQLGKEPTLEFQADPGILSMEAAEPVADLPPEPQPGLEPQPGPKNMTRDPEPAGLSEPVVATAHCAEVAEAARTAGVGGIDNDEVEDPGVDYIVDIHAATVIPDSSLAEVLQRKFDFSKPVRWLGQRDPGASWEEISAESAGTRGYVNLRGCLQLADRGGPVSEVSLAEFRDLAKNLATRLMAEVNCPDIREAHARAVALDEFCAEVDVMIGINIISGDNSVFTGAKIQVLAESSGFKLGTEGMFHYYDQRGTAVFSLGNSEPAPFLHTSMRMLTTHGVTFLLDVSRVENGPIIFGEMVHVAGAFADALGGVMVDDNRVPLTDNGIRKIKQQLITIQSLMQARNLPAGGKLALRLFA
jgi:FtsZ-interacting cell division protein ZipA